MKTSPNTSNPPASFEKLGQIVDLASARIYPGRIRVVDGRIDEVREVSTDTKDLILPGLVDAHGHLESTLGTAAQVGSYLLRHGVVQLQADPHEIANVLGRAGVEFMVEDAKKTDLKINFGVPSCVPATPATPPALLLESSGAELNANTVANLLSKDEHPFLAEMMNWPGVLSRDPEVMAKIATAKRLGKPIDGHGPGMSEEQVLQYAAAGITTDHECVNLAEALFRISAGMKVIVREGSAARNLDALMEAIDLHPESTMLCTDDLHPDLAIDGSIHKHVQRLLAAGIDPIKIFTAASRTPNLHYGLGLGQLQKGDPADFIVARSLSEFEILETYLQGRRVGYLDHEFASKPPHAIPNNFNIGPIALMDLRVPAQGTKIRVIDVEDGQLITGSSIADAKIANGEIVADPSRDILKVVVINRYREAPAAVGFVRNFGLKHGAMASTVAHDCHNIVAVGANDKDLLNAINSVIEAKGGLSFASEGQRRLLPLPIAGLMSDQDLPTVAKAYTEIDSLAKNVGGTTLRAPFMTLSFLALVVIPSAKISDRGLIINFRREEVIF